MLAACIQGYQEVLLPNMGSARDKRGVRESSAKVTFFAKNGRLRIKDDKGI